MTYQVVEVNHRNLVDVIDAVYVLEDRATIDRIMEYSDITQDSANKALTMAIQLEFLTKSGDHYKSILPFARLLANAETNTKKHILKFKLMEHEPFRFFALQILKGEEVTRAASKTKVAFGITGSTTILKNAFLDLGSFSGIFAETNKGIEVSFDSETGIRNLFESISAIISDETQLENFVESQLEASVAEYIESFKKRLIAAGLKYDSNPEACIKDSADVFEDFLKKLCSDESIDITRATGIIEVGDRMKSNAKITSKHQGFIHFIGQMRNAFKHTTDSEIGRSWKTSSELSFELFLVTLTAINSIFLYIKRNECIL